MRQSLFKNRSDVALSDIIAASNPDFPSNSFTVSNITDLGAAANPNTSAVITGDGVKAVGKSTIAFNRLNPKNTFEKFGSVVRRPVIDAFAIGGYTQGQAVPLSAIAVAVEKSLGLVIRTGGSYPDADGTQTVTMPAVGSYTDVDMVFNQANSLRFRPSATDKLPFRIRNAGKIWGGSMTGEDIRQLTATTLDETEPGLVCYLPLGTDLSSAYTGATSAIAYKSGQNHDVVGDATLNASFGALTGQEWAVTAGKTVANFPFASNMNDTISAVAATIAGSVAIAADTGALNSSCASFTASTSTKLTAGTAARDAIRNAIGGLNSWTLEFEANFPNQSATTTYGAIATMYSGAGWGTGDNWGIFVNSSGTIFMHAQSGTTMTWITQVDAIGDSKWHKYSIVRDGTTVRMYVDGVLRSTKTFTLSINNNAIPLQFGNVNNGSLSFSGKLRNFRVTNSVLYTADYTPVAPYSAAVAKQNLIRMTASELATSTWKMITNIVPVTTEPTGTSVKWMFSAGGLYYYYDTVNRKLVQSDISQIGTVGITTAALTALRDIPYRGVAKLGLVAALYTDGQWSPSVTSATINYATQGASTTFGTTAPVPNSPCKLRAGVGTLFTNGGVSIGKDLANSRVALNTLLQSTADFTIEVDLQRTVLGGTDYDTIFWNSYINGDQGTDGLGLAIRQSDGLISFGGAGTDNAWHGTLSTIAINDLLPHKFELVKKATVFYCFVDGALAATYTFSWTPRPSVAPFGIGWGTTAPAGFTRPFRGYMRDFKIWNYARYNVAHSIPSIVTTVPGGAALNNAGYVKTADKKKCLQSLLYNLDMSATIRGIPLATIVSESTTSVVKGSVITAINAKLAAAGINATCAQLTLTDTTVANLFAKATDGSKGQNPNLAIAITSQVIDWTVGSDLFVSGPVTLHLKS